MKMYKLLESDGMGYFNTHTEWLTKVEAESMRDKHAKDFPDSDWIIEPHEEDSPENRGMFRDIPSDACDGWEDIYPNRD